ncbi:hypothetical protein CNR22_03610 [Sphingobacteriaceae bacterium]|nr:hypothetical protein CNR22_03610 [Sphingobacteriaceae bacterium]
MENTIINRKQISLEKNKEVAFKIPYLINPSECTFHVETAPNSLTRDCIIQFLLRSTKIGAERKKVVVSIQINEMGEAKLFKDTNMQGDHILLGCISNENINFALTISKKSSSLIR